MVINTAQLHSTKPEPCLLCIRNLWWWGSLTVVPAADKAKCLSSVNHTTKTIHLHHHHSVLINPIGKGVQSWSMENIYPMRHFYCDTITRRVANQGYRGIFSPWDKTVPAGHQPSISLPWGKVPFHILFQLPFHGPFRVPFHMPFHVPFNVPFQVPFHVLFQVPWYQVCFHFSWKFWNIKYPHLKY